MKLSDFEFELPLASIAQQPAKVRDQSKLMILDRNKQTVKHDYFYNLRKYLNAGDTLVFNDTKVYPAKLVGKKDTGGKVEVLLLPPHLNEFIGRNIGKAKRIHFEGGLIGEISEKNTINFNVDNAKLMSIIDKIGYTPIPPYIKREKNKPEPKGWRDRYQTVYAKNVGSAAAPTAGFHFTRQLIKNLSDEGIALDYVTLHVGLGTFAPITTNDIEKHNMHSEWYVIGDKTIEHIKEMKRNNKRILGVGTTSVRTLESWARTGKTSDETDIYIYPGYKFAVVDGMITNFHMPKSSLVLLVAAFAGRDFILNAYKKAVEMGYRFGSFGDAMFIM